MTNCECLPKCIFFNDNMAEVPVTAERLKKKYCLGDYSACARYMIFKKLGREHVPENLYPHQVEKAEEILGL